MGVIEAHVEATVGATEQGVKDLEKAQDYVRACRWKGLLAMMLVLTTVGVFLGVSEKCARTCVCVCVCVRVRVLVCGGG